MKTREWIAVAMAAAVLAAGLCSGRASGATIESAGSGMWTNPATWTPAQAPTSDDDVTITNGCTVTMNDMVTRSASNLTIQAGGVLTHSDNGNTEAYKLDLTLNGALDIQAGGAIDVDGLGYDSAGPGAGGGAGGYGGVSGYWAGAAWGWPGTTYGSITSPTNCGSGSQQGGAGGGAAILRVRDGITLNGRITARAANSGYQGSGGSVFLTTSTLTGSGTIDAGVLGSGLTIPGGGGRISVILTNGTDFGSITMRAFTTYGSQQEGSPGTIYRQTKDQAAGYGTLLIDAGNIVAGVESSTLQKGDGTSSYEFSEIVLTNGARYRIDTNDTLIVTNTVVRGSPVDRKEGIEVNGGTLTIPADLVFSNYYIRIVTNSTPFAPSSVTVGTNADLEIDQPFTLNCPLTVQAGGVLTHHDNGNTEAYKLDLTLNGALDIQAGGAVNVDGKGYDSAGPGAGTSASYGGYGGYWTGSYYPGPTYGSITSPTNCGSGSNQGAAGGGAVILRVRDGITLNGSITARAASSGYQGSGGSVFLTTSALTGSGTIDAGVLGSSLTIPGGGGRISVILTNGADFGSITMRAFTTSGSQQKGSPGTIYKQTKDQAAGYGTLLIDAGNIVAGVESSTVIGPLVKDAAVGKVIVQNAGKLSISNQTLGISGDLTNAGTFRGDFGSTVVFQGTNAAAVYGSNTFYNLVCTNIGETLSFQDARTNTVNGVLTLANITLNSISGGQWFMKASPSTHNVTNVNVSRSDARPGSAVEAFDSVNGGNNYNWVFAESGFCTNYWTGAVNSDWTDTNNWSRGRSTQLSDTVVVTNGSPNYPQLQAETRILSLVVSNGAWMGLSSYNLVVDDDVRIAGALAASGTEKLTIGGDLDFSGGGVFTAANSTVWIAGSNAQTVTSGGISFRNLSISNSAASVMFTDAVSATNIVNYATPVTFGGAVTAQALLRTVGTNVIFGGAVNVPSFYNETGALVFSGTVTTVGFTNWGANLTFRDNVLSDWFYSAPGGNTHTFGVGKLVTVGNLEWYGRGGYPLVLRSLEDGKAWDLKVTNWSNVRQVDVKDSNAQPGLAINPVASTNSGGNTNWVFSGPWQTWVGTVSSSFTNSGNWTPAGVPGEGTRLLVDGYYTSAPTLSGAVTVAQLIVGSVTTATLTVNGHLTVLGDVEVLPKGTITHSANGGTEANRLYMTVVSNLTINGSINVDGKGYAGPGGGSSSASYGGYGGYWTGAYYPGPTYGSITSPTNCGSSCGGAAGGGAAILTVNGATVLNGSITARAPVGGYQGSGGSVFLTTGTLTGSGTIDAGVLAGSITCPGGGGRIAVILTNDTVFGSITMRAFTTSGSHEEGSPGTIYKQTKDQAAGCGTLLVDADNIVAGVESSTVIGPLVTNREVGTVIVTNAAKLTISNQTLTVQGNWIIAPGASFTAYTNSTVDFGGANSATIYTNNTFFNLTCTNAGKVLSFEAGRTNTVTGLLKLGASQSGQMVTLQSTTPGSWSYLTLAPGGTQTIARVNVKDNNASGGQLLVAGGGSANGGNNINWQFPPSGTMFMVR